MIGIEREQHDLTNHVAVGGAAGTLAGLPIARRLGQRAVLGRRLFAGLILVVAAYVAIRAVGAL